LCRVIKKNEKASATQGENKGKRAGSSSINGTDTSVRFSGEQPFSNSGDSSSQASHLNNESRYSSPISSPYNVPPMGEINLASLETNPSNFWISPDMILDSSKVYLSRNKEGKLRLNK